MSFYRNNNSNSIRREYEEAVAEGLQGKLGIDELPNKMEVAFIIVTTLFKESNGAVINIKKEDGGITPMKFEVVNGVPDITRYKLMPSAEDKISGKTYSTIHTLTGMDGRRVMEDFKNDLITIEAILAEALAAAYQNGLEFIYTQGIRFVYPMDNSIEGPLVITGLVDSENEVVYKYATTSSINLTFKDDYSKISRI